MIRERRVKQHWMKVEMTVMEVVIIVFQLLEAVVVMCKVLKVIRGVQEAVEVWAITCRLVEIVEVVEARDEVGIWMGGRRRLRLLLVRLPARNVWANYQEVLWFRILRTIMVRIFFPDVRFVFEFEVFKSASKWCRCGKLLSCILKELTIRWSWLQTSTPRK